ncbi:MAG: methyltransferase domain-containing protein [Candidatus Woesearchaeota archaeon]
MQKSNKLWYRSRGLEMLESRFGNNSIQSFIKKRLDSHKEFRILEIGFGEGKCLIELRKKYPNKNLLLYGINDKKKGNMHSKLDFYTNAEKFYQLIPKNNLPKPFFYDVGKGLRFENDYFDLVISQVCIPYIDNKAFLFEEIWRVLKKDGRAFLHIDSETNEEYPDFMKLCKDTPRMVIYQNNKIIPTKKIFDNAKKQGYSVNFSRQKDKKESFIVTMEKNLNKKLNFNLLFDGNSTLYLTKLKDTDEYKTQSEIWWGARSVFKVKK